MRILTALRSLRTRVQAATSETESKIRYQSVCVHHYTLRAPCAKDQGKARSTLVPAFLISTVSISYINTANPTEARAPQNWYSCQEPIIKEKELASRAASADPPLWLASPSRLTSSLLQ